MNMIKYEHQLKQTTTDVTHSRYHLVEFSKTTWHHEDWKIITNEAEYPA